MLFESRRPASATRRSSGRHFHGRRTVRLWTDDGSPVRETIDAIGHVPLPPYIKRAGCDERSRSLSNGLRARARIDCRADRRTCTSRRRCSTRCGARASSASASRCTSATERSSRFASIASTSTRWKREHYDVSDGSRGGAVERAKREGRRIDRRRHDDDEDAGIAGGIARRGRSPPGRGETALFIRPGHEFSAGVRARSPTSTCRSRRC